MIKESPAHFMRVMLFVSAVIWSGFALAGCSGSSTPWQSTDTVAPRGDDEIVAPEEITASEPEVGAMTLSTTAFEPGAEIPALYARVGVEGGANVSIPYEWSGMPSGTRSLALIVVDLHPIAHEWVHWLVVDMAPNTVALPEGASRIEIPAGARELENTFGEAGYEGPQPPEGSGGHEYRATVYALDVATLDVERNPDHGAFLEAIEGHVLAKGSVSGFFGR